MNRFVSRSGRIAGVVVGFVLTGAAFVPPAGADDPKPVGPGSHARTFAHGGVTRHYRLYVPKSYDGTKPVPLVFAFHGGGPRGSALTAEKGLGFNPLADQHGFLVCYPEGVEHHWNDGRVSPRFPKPEQDDVDFVAKILLP